MKYLSECTDDRGGFQIIPSEEEVKLMQALINKWNGKELPEDWLINKK